MSVFIGRKLNIGLGKEATRGTAVAAAYWYPKTDLAVDSKIDTVVNDQSLGIIEDAQTQEITKKWAQATISGIATDTRLGLLLMAALGTDTKTTTSGESSVYDHTFSVLESAQHPSMTIVVSEPNASGAASVRYTNAMLTSLELAFEVGKFATYKAGFDASIGTTASSTPSFTDETTFNPQYCKAYFAATLAGVQGTLTATGTAASTVNVTGLSISTTLIQVGMTVTGTNVPAGATVAAIVSASAFTLSAATTGAMGTITFGGQVVNIRSAKLTIAKNIEDDPTIGSLTVVDRYNKQFAIEGEMVLVYNDRTYIDTDMLGDLTRAIRLSAINTGSTIGTASNSSLIIDLARCKITEVARSGKNNDVVMQTIKFKAYYSVSDSTMVSILLRNTNATAY